MVGFIDIHRLTLDELAGVVNLYPWYGAARVEMCRRMLSDGWGEGEMAAQALFVADRRKLSVIARSTVPVDCTDKDVKAILASFMAPKPVDEIPSGEHSVRVVGGDYFSQAQYDNVKEQKDNIFTRFAFKAPKNVEEAEEGTSDMAERFATETLARIFAEQGRTEEARRIYSRLVLEIPEKSAYFASLIDNLE